MHATLAAHMLVALLSHPGPRRVALPLRGGELDLDNFACPALSSLDRGTRASTRRLHRHLWDALAQGLAPSVLDARTKASQGVAPFYTRESAAWPKPVRCHRRRLDVCAFSPHFCLTLPYGNAPRTSLVSERHGFEFRQVWKVASSSLASFFFCNMYGDLREEKLLPGQPPQKLHAAGARLVAFPTREPIGRFVASALEVLDRLLNRRAPGGHRMADDMYAEPRGPFSASVLTRSTKWYLPLQRLLNNSSPEGSRERAVQLHDLVNGFIEDLECGVVYSASEHLATQTSFITSGYASRAALGFQIRLENLTHDLGRLGEAIGYRTEPPAPRNGSVWKCAVGRENEGASRAKVPVAKAEFQATLASHPSLVQRLCTVYIQDFMCLGFTLPAECQGGRELSWVRATATRGGRPGSSQRAPSRLARLRRTAG